MQILSARPAHPKSGGKKLVDWSVRFCGETFAGSAEASFITVPGYSISPCAHTFISTSACFHPHHGPDGNLKIADIVGNSHRNRFAEEKGWEGEDNYLKYSSF